MRESSITNVLERKKIRYIVIAQTVQKYIFQDIAQFRNFRDAAFKKILEKFRIR